MRLLTVGNCYVIPEPLSFVRSHTMRESVLIKGNKLKAVFERYRFMDSVEATTPKSDPVYPRIAADAKNVTIRCAAVAYQMLPTIYKKQSRETFKKAFKIGVSKGVLFAPITHYIKWRYLKKLLNGK